MGMGLIMWLVMESEKQSIWEGPGNVSNNINIKYNRLQNDNIVKYIISIKT